MMAEIPTQPRQFDGFRPGRLWSLWDMLKINAATYLNLGGRLEAAARVFGDAEDITQHPYGRSLTNAETKELKELVEDLLGECQKLSLPVSSEILQQRLDYLLPRNQAELDTVLDVIRAELKSQLFLFIPPHVVSYFENDHLPLHARAEFRGAAGELTRAGTCHSAGESTAAVFHAMRGAEVCVRVLAKAIGARFERPIEQEEWQFILNRISERFREIGNGPRSEKRKADLEFFGTAAAQLQFFKDGWRVRAAHAGELFNESTARDAIDHVRALIVILAEGGLSENP